VDVALLYDYSEKAGPVIRFNFENVWLNKENGSNEHAAWGMQNDFKTGGQLICQTLLTLEGSSQGTISSSRSSDGIEFRLLPDIYLCFFPILLILFAVASTFIFSFIGLRVLCVGISLSLYLAYFVNFLFPLLPRHSYTLYIDGIVPICQCNLCSLPFKIS